MRESMKFKNTNYQVCWRFNIDRSPTVVEKSQTRFLKHYMPKWSAFMKEVMANRLLVCQIRDLPELRKLIKVHSTKVEDIFELLSSRNKKLASMMIESSPIFDISPTDLKAYILAVCGIDSASYKEYLS